jgi:hypothetical protein
MFLGRHQNAMFRLRAATAMASSTAIAIRLARYDVDQESQVHQEKIKASGCHDIFLNEFGSTLTLSNQRTGTSNAIRC